MQWLYDFLVDNAIILLILVAVIVLGLILSRLFVKFLRNILCKTNIDHTAVTFITSFVKFLLYAFILITVLSIVGVNVASILTAIGAAALTAGLAVKDSLGNLVSGLIILLNKPFVAGDILEFEGVKGKVVSIKIFFTTINTLDNKAVTIPNSRLTANNVVNCTMVDKRRLDLRYTISYDDDISKTRNVIYKLISNCDKILQDPEPKVYVGEHLDSGIEILVFVWIAPDDYYDVYYFMQENVKLAFDKNGITIPYPHISIKK